MRYFKSLMLFIASLGFTILGCTRSYVEVKDILITIDPNRLEDKYQVIRLTNLDSIANFMRKFNNKEVDPVKFYPRFIVEINFANRKEIYYGNANHFKDSTGTTYKLMEQDWEIYRY